MKKILFLFSSVFLNLSQAVEVLPDESICYKPKGKACLTDDFKFITVDLLGTGKNDYCVMSSFWPVKYYLDNLDGVINPEGYDPYSIKIDISPRLILKIVCEGIAPHEVTNTSVISDSEAKVNVTQLLCSELEQVEANNEAPKKQKVTLLKNPTLENDSSVATFISKVEPKLIHQNSFSVGCDIEDIRKIKKSATMSFAYAKAIAKLTTESTQVNGEDVVRKETLEITVRVPNEERAITLKSVVFGNK